MDVSSAISAQATDSITFTRTSTTYVNGVAVVTTSSVGPFVSIIEPVMGRDLRRVPQGQRQRGTVKLLCLGLPAMGDEFTFKGALYNVIHVDDWSSFGYAGAVAVKKEVT